MNYISFIFAGFVILTVLLYYLIPKKYRYLVLLFSSMLFYFSNSRWMVIMVCLSTVVIYFSAKGMSKNNDDFSKKKAELNKTERKALKSAVKKKNKTMLIVAVLLNIGLLVVLKYGNFIIENLNALMNSLSNGCFNALPKMSVLVPLGISYYTLMAVSYVTDVYRGRIKAENNPLILLLFLTFFPYILEGPIGRCQSLSGQLSKGNDFEYSNFQTGLFYLISGLFKKLVIADRLVIYVNEVFEHYQNYQGFVVLLTIILFVIQIYADFSGSIEIITGIARFFGIKLDENFRQPFFSKNIQEFWRRWHITLGSWLRDYIFYPVSLSKGVSKLSRKIKNPYWASLTPLLIANFAVWLTMGIWHGASWKYVIYGLYYFLLVAISIFLQPVFEKFKNKHKWTESRGYHFFQMVRTFLLVTLGMLIFRADTIQSAIQMLGRAFTGINLTAIKQDITAVFVNVGYNNFGIIEILIIVLSIFLFWFYDLYCASGKDALLSGFKKKPLVIRWMVEMGSILLILLIGIYGPAYSSGAFIYGGF